VRRVLAVGGIAVAILLGLALGALVLLLATGTLKAFAIPTSAMETTLHCARPAPGCQAETKDRVLVLTRFVSYERGDLVVFDAPAQAKRECGFGGTYVKRIVGLPGERVELRLVEGRAHVYVDGARLDEPYVDDARRSRTRGRWSVPDESYFVLADNRAVSCDSSIWGPLPADDVDGEIVMTYWPLDRITIR
jgi:signal peptidase I